METRENHLGGDVAAASVLPQHQLRLIKAMHTQRTKQNERYSRVIRGKICWKRFRS